jgi:spore germination cell wall hydrolase CwlJ-like protein
MVASRIRVLSASYSTRFWLSACSIALMPTSIGYQDLAALIAHGRSESVPWHLIASPFGTFEAATFNYSRPVGTAMPEPLGFQHVNFDPRSLDAYSWKIDEPLNARPSRQVDYPVVQRAHKGDRLPAASVSPAPADPAPMSQLQPLSAPAMEPPPAAAPQPSVADQSVTQPTVPVAKMDAHSEVAALPQPAATPAPNAVAAADTVQVSLHVPNMARSAVSDDDAALLGKPPDLPAPGETEEAPSSFEVLSYLDDANGDRSAQIFFGNGSMGAPSVLQSWAPGAEPMLVAPPIDPNIKLSALEESDVDNRSGEMVIGKDESRVQSPAEQLGLTGKPRIQAEKCLADVIYFEARGEVMKGQQAVAQVVMNRVFSGYYPHDVCGVVYQNAGRHLACQFTFACEGKDLNKLDEPDMWEQAKQIAKDMLDGKIWLAEVGHATHYHAYWVHPSWVHEMAKLYHLGVHTFYRPLNWGNGDDEPVWGPSATSRTNAPDKFSALRPDPEAISENPLQLPKTIPAPTAAKSEPTAKL